MLPCDWVIIDNPLRVVFCNMRHTHVCGAACVRILHLFSTSLERAAHAAHEREWFVLRN